MKSWKKSGPGLLHRRMTPFFHPHWINSFRNEVLERAHATSRVAQGLWREKRPPRDRGRLVAPQEAALVASKEEDKNRDNLHLVTAPTFHSVPKYLTSKPAIDN